MNVQQHLIELRRHFWDYAEHFCPPEVLDGKPRSDTRPPVFNADHRHLNVLTPTNVPDALCTDIYATIAPSERHRHFGSMASSQALAQSVFGSLRVLGKLSVLSRLTDDTGRALFESGSMSDHVTLEHNVDCLGEPRPTSVDVWFDGHPRIAVECKLTEAEFGTCSRPRLRLGRDANYARDHCDGTYTRQRGRRSRCSLTEIGVEYWRHLGEVFDWDADTDLTPCPMRATYQLARNVLAACVQPNREIDPSAGYSLIIYDARHPAYHAGGVADVQWGTASDALRHPGLLRRCSWQAVAGALSADPDLDWLVGGLDAKYGIRDPDTEAKR